MYADVAVCLPLTRTFVYRLPQPVEVGCRVAVPFRNREVEGFIAGLQMEPPAGIEVHSIANIIDPAPLLRPDIFELCRWISDYYIAPLGEVLKSALPPGISAKHVEKGARSDPLAAGGGRGSLRAPFSRRPALNNDQTAAFTAIQATAGFRTLLLHGLTGSGK